MCKVFCGWAGKSTSSWFCLSCWSVRKSKYVGFQRNFFELHLRSFPGRCCRFPCCCSEIPWPNFFKSRENSDPRKRMVLVHRLNSDFHSILALQETSCNFQYGPNLGVPSYPTFWFRWIFISWHRVLATSHWISKLWELSSVFCHEVLSNTNPSNNHEFQFRPSICSMEVKNAVSAYTTFQESCADFLAPNIDFRLNEHPRWNTNWFLSIVWEHDPSSQVQSFSPPGWPWMVRKENGCKNSDNTDIWFCCFLSTCNWSNLCQWVDGFHPFGTEILDSDFTISNDLPASVFCLEKFSCRPNVLKNIEIWDSHLYQWLNSLAKLSFHFRSCRCDPLTFPVEQSTDIYIRILHAFVISFFRKTFLVLSIVTHPRANLDPLWIWPLQTVFAIWVGEVANVAMQVRIDECPSLHGLENTARSCGGRKSVEVVVGIALEVTVQEQQGWMNHEKGVRVEMRWCTVGRAPRPMSIHKNTTRHKLLAPIN